MLSKTTLEAAKLVDEAMEQFKATLAKNGKTVDDWLEEQKIYIEETRQRVAERERNKMSRYLIKEVKCEVANGGMACGPVGGPVVAAVLYEHDGEEQWLHAVEVEGMLNVFIMEDDIYDILIKDAYDGDYVEKLEAETGHEIAGVMLTGDYCDIVCELYDNEELTDYDKSFIRFVLAIMRCNWDEVRELQAASIGRYTDELSIPLSDVEEEYLEENMEE